MTLFKIEVKSLKFAKKQIFQYLTKNLSIEKLNQQEKTTPKQSTEVFQVNLKFLADYFLSSPSYGDDLLHLQAVLVQIIIVLEVEEKQEN